MARKYETISSGINPYTLNKIDNDFIYLYENVGMVNEMVERSKTTLEEAERVNAENTNTNDRLDNIIAGSGTSSTEVVDARLDAEGNEYPVLKDRLDESDAQLAQKPTHSEMLTPTNKVRMIAHRGLSASAPENTLPAYELAGQAGFWGGECDVQTTSDGVWILMHDSTVDRTTNGTGSVGTLTYNEIKSLTVDGGKNAGLYPNLKIPSLEEYLKTCRKYEIVPVIEIKSQTYTDQNYDDFIRVIKEHAMETRCVVISFSTTVCSEIRSRSDKVAIQPVIEITTANLDFTEGLGNAGIDAPHNKLSEQKIKQAHARGILVNCWTVNNSRDLQHYVEWGIDFVTTDRLLGV